MNNISQIHYVFIANCCCELFNNLNNSVMWILQSTNVQLGESEALQDSVTCSRSQRQNTFKLSVVSGDARIEGKRSPRGQWEGCGQAQGRVCHRDGDFLQQEVISIFPIWQMRKLRHMGVKRFRHKQTQNTQVSLQNSWGFSSCNSAFWGDFVPPTLHETSVFRT